MGTKHRFEPDFYDRLGVDPSVDDDTLRQQYRLLARLFHPDVNKAPDAHQRFVGIRESYDVLGDPGLRAEYDTWLAAQRPEAFLLRVVHTLGPKALRLSAGRQRLYALVELEVVDEETPEALPINLVLVLDRSSSMRGERLYHAQRAVRLISQHLGPRDRLGIVTFSDRAQVILPAGPYMQPEVVASAMNSIRTGGGTEISSGLEAGLREALRGHSPNVISHIILLTDGQTYGDEERCLELAGQAARHRIGLTLFGLGADWNDRLLDEMARRAGGEAFHIAEPADAVEAFKKRLDVLRRTAANETRLAFALQPGVELLAVHQVMPSLQRLSTNSNGHIPVGQLLKGVPARLLLEFAVTPERDRRVLLVAQLSAATTLLSRNTTVTQTRLLVSQARDITVDDLEFPESIVDAAERVAALRLQQHTWEAVEKGNRVTAEIQLAYLATRFLEIGEPGLAAITKRELAFLRKTGALSSEGSKRIKYGTRQLSLPPPEEI